MAAAQVAPFRPADLDRDNLPAAEIPHKRRFFIIAVVLISVVGSLLGAPAYYWVDEGIEFGIWKVNQLWEALILTAAGTPAFFIALHTKNGIAFISGSNSIIFGGRLSDSTEALVRPLGADPARMGTQ